MVLDGCSNDSAQGNGGRERLIPALEAVEADFGSLPLIERLSGVVKAKNQVEIYPEISGVIEVVHVENGDDVNRGQPLISLRDIEFSERLKQAKAAHQIAQAQASRARARLSEVESELKRINALSEKGLSSESELESAETQFSLAKADLDLAKAQVDQAAATIAERQEALKRTVIRAPIKGTIGNRNAEVGMMISTGTRLFTLGQLDSVRVDVVLTDIMLNYIEIGQRADIRAPNLSSGITAATISRISPYLHPVTHSTDGEIDLANPDHTLKSGMFVTVDVYYGESEQATLVPLSALYENPLTGETGVYIGRDTSNLIPVEPLEAGGKGILTDPVYFDFTPIEIIAKGRMSAGVRGVEPGNWVVTLGQDLLGGKPGSARVRPVDWTWVEKLQTLQREDLLEEVIQKQAEKNDSASTEL